MRFRSVYCTGQRILICQLRCPIGVIRRVEFSCVQCNGVTGIPMNINVMMRINCCSLSNIPGINDLLFCVSVIVVLPGINDLLFYVSLMVFFLACPRH